MNQDEQSNPPENLRDTLAELAHEQWADWMRYLFDKSTWNEDDGTVTIPAWAVTRWKRQVLARYHELSEQEQASDLAEADKVLALIGKPTSGVPDNEAPREPSQGTEEP